MQKSAHARSQSARAQVTAQQHRHHATPWLWTTLNASSVRYKFSEHLSDELTVRVRSGMHGVQFRHVSAAAVGQTVDGM